MTRCRWTTVQSGILSPVRTGYCKHVSTSNHGNTLAADVSETLRKSDLIISNNTGNVFYYFASCTMLLVNRASSNVLPTPIRYVRDALVGRALVNPCLLNNFITG